MVLLFECIEVFRQIESSRGVAKRIRSTSGRVKSAGQSAIVPDLPTVNRHSICH